MRKNSTNLLDVEPVIHHSDKKQREITKRDVEESVAHVETGLAASPASWQ